MHLEKDEKRLKKYAELRTQIEQTMRLDDLEIAKDQHKLTEAKQRSTERKSIKTRLQNFGEVVEFDDQVGQDDESNKSQN